MIKYVLLIIYIGRAYFLGHPVYHAYASCASRAKVKKIMLRVFHSSQVLCARKNVRMSITSVTRIVIH